MENSNILWVTKSYLMPESGIKSHSHPFIHMIYAADGEASFTAGSEDTVLKAGTVVLIPKDVKHAYINNSENAAGGIFNFLEIKFVPSKHFEEIFSGEKAFFSTDSLAGELFKKIVFEYGGNSGFSDDAAESYLDAMLNIIAENYCTERESSSKYVDTSAFTPLSKRIVEWLEEHYAENVSLDDLADTLGYNKSYLCKAYKQNTENTILDTLNMIRIRHAAEIITYSDLSLSQVAKDCGFATVSHFNRVFHSYVGITPGQCRRVYPADILFGPGFKNTSKNGTPDISKPDRFMKSVLTRQNY